MAGMTGKNSISSRQYNRGLILKLIATGVCNTRIDLSRTTKLAKMTVTNIISEFLEQGLVTECEEEPTEVCGRNPIRLQIAEKAPKVVGLLILRDRIEAVLGTMTLELLRTESICFDELTEESLIQYSCDVIDRVLSGETEVLGIGVAALGPVDIKRGIIMSPPRFYGIHDIDIVSVLKEKYSLPVYLDHDNSSAALAENLFGSGQKVQDFIFLGVSNGIGSGIISGGEVFHNRQGFEAEIGHMSIDRNGILCPCGNKGCLEMYASSHVVLEKLQSITGRKADFKDFCQMSKDSEIKTVFEEMVEDIGAALVNIVNLLHPEMIVLGCDCIFWDEKYVKMLEEIVNSKQMIRQNHICIKKAYFGENAQLLGAAANILNQTFKGNLLWTD
ncbi:MAG: ROK family protein [Bariatricus sp.]|nr:ROK family protein [Bariatricus sp.]